MQWYKNIIEASSRAICRDKRLCIAMRTKIKITNIAIGDTAKIPELLSRFDPGVEIAFKPSIYI